MVDESWRDSIAGQIWDAKYRLKCGDGTVVDLTVEDTWWRIASALANAEKPEEHAKWMAEFYEALEDFKFLPAGRIVAGAGTDRNVTNSNCFVLGTIPDSLDGIFDQLKEAAITMQSGGGIGHDFSTIRPEGAPVRGVDSDASGPLSFMDCWDSMCRTIMSAGSRRGAMMATLRCDHPDVFKFVAAKQDPLRLRNFNVSVLVTDGFMAAVEDDAEWDLVFDGETYSTVRARDLWDRIMRSTYDYAEPGVIFIDRINQTNNLGAIETISATNPCGEQPLPPYGACLLGSINLAMMVKSPYQNSSHISQDELRKLVRTAVRMMDNVNDVSKYPLPQQAAEAQAKRRIGLGVTGLADALLMCGLEYGSKGAVEMTDYWLGVVAEEAYLTTADLAEEKGSYPLWDADAVLSGDHFANKLPGHVKDALRTKGARNSHLLSIAPTGTISLYAGNVSSGGEPIFAPSYTRKVLERDGKTRREERVVDHAIRVWEEMRRELKVDEETPPNLITAQDLPPSAHVAMQAVLQKWVDTSVSKTVNLPASISFDEFKSVYWDAYRQGCKGCTTYRPNDVTGSVLSVDDAPKPEDNGLPEGTTGEHTPIKIGSDTVAATHPPLRPRPEAMRGTTYKIQWPEGAFYVTINDDTEGRPFEIFVVPKNPEHQAWTTALTRMVSAIFRRGGDIDFVAEELKEVFDPRGGAWLDGTYHKSVAAAIGHVVEKHMHATDEISSYTGGTVAGKPAIVGERGPEVVVPPSFIPKAAPTANKAFMCPKCGSQNTKLEAGCRQCLDCGHSKCG